jgi:hypothetical protein
MQKGKWIVVRAIVVFVVVFGALTWPWPGWGRTFCSGYAAIAAAALHPVFGDEVTFDASRKGDRFDEWDLLIRFQPPPGSNNVRGVRVQIRRICYLPLSFFLAFAAACPAKSRRSFVLGASACLFALAILQSAAVLFVFTTRGALNLGSFLNLTISLVGHALVEAPAMSFAVQALSWSLLAKPFDAFRAAFRR